ncbi:MAG: hypothetical protein LQ338_000087 [Usnochroma carphineum]|nr:MAG: hypothetical protein LQ338_000087 [Usnochroma carphineum]
MAHDQYLEPSHTPGHWASLFMYDTATTKVVETTYLVGVVNGTLHLVSLIISIYLAVLFRKISNLPPDMNPLEENLTSRHKRNKSELLDNRTSQVSTETGSKGHSRAEEPLISPVRSVPFMHTRNESSVNINNVPYPHFSPRASRTSISAPLYEQPLSNRSSRTNTRQQAFYSQPASQTNINHKPGTPTSQRQHYSKSSSAPFDEPTLLRSPTKSSSVYTDDLASTRAPSTRPFSTAPSLPQPTEHTFISTSDKHSQNDNWITYPTPSPSPPIELKHLRQSNPYQPFPRDQQPSPPSSHYMDIENRTPRPLEMNPPTPVGARFDGRVIGTTIDQRALMPGTGNMLGLNGGKGLDFNPSRTTELSRERDGSRYGGELGGKARGGEGYGYGAEKGARVVSRSGVEFGRSQGMGRDGVRAREVSGKVVEEGKSGQERGWGLAR